jgi:hypothetical protein
MYPLFQLTDRRTLLAYSRTIVVALAANVAVGAPELAMAQEAARGEHAPISIDIGSLAPDQILALMRLNDAQFDNLKFRILLHDRKERKSNVPLNIPESNLDQAALWRELKLPENENPGAMNESEFAKRLAQLLTKEQLEELRERGRRAELPAKPGFEIRSTAVPSEPCRDFVVTMVVRFPEVAALRELAPGCTPSIGQPQHHRWSFRGTERRHLYKTFFVPQSQPKWIMEIRRASADSSQELQKLTMYQFACGIGYGNRMRTISSVTRLEDGNYELIGDFRMYDSSGDEASTYRFIVDDQLVVRDAAINLMGNSGGWASLFVTTRGSRVWDDGRLRTAERGTLKSVVQNVNTQDHFDIELEQIQFDITDEEFLKFFRMEAPPGERVSIMDYEKLRERPKARTARRPGEFQGTSTSHIWLVSANLAAIIILSILLVRQRRLNRESQRGQVSFFSVD